MENKKICPFCGAEINEKAKKCRFCNNWLDEEVDCPFCGEKIKASAKKCRFCGEWLPENEKSDEKSATGAFKFDFKSLKFDIKDKKTIIITSVLCGVALIGILWLSFGYVPSCNSNYIQKELTQNIKLKFPEITTLNINKSSITALQHNSDGYSCKASVITDNDTTFNVEYTYNKVSFKNYNFNTKIVLPDCYDSGMKNLLIKAIKEQDYMNIKDLASDVEVEDAAVLNFDKETPAYKCSATATITAKPGQAFAIGWWGDADKKISCNIEYKNIFCGKGYTSCVNLNSITDCKYKED